MIRRFRDRTEAGRLLAAALDACRSQPNLIVLGLPRGGVPVAFEVARALGAPLDIFLVRKLGVPGQEELAMGAIASGGVQVLNEAVVRATGVSPQTIERIAAAERQELDRRAKTYRGDRPPLVLAGRTVLLIDDGLATGASMRAAVQAVRSQKPVKIVVAVPVAPSDTCAGLRGMADEVVCLTTPEPFYAVGSWYDDFAQTTDEEVRDLLARASGTPLTDGWRSL